VLVSARAASCGKLLYKHTNTARLRKRESRYLNIGLFDFGDMFSLREVSGCFSMLNYMNIFDKIMLDK